MWACLCLLPTPPSAPVRTKSSTLVQPHFGQKELQEICTPSRVVFILDSWSRHLRRESLQFAHQENPPGLFSRVVTRGHGCWEGPVPGAWFSMAKATVVRGSCSWRALALPPGANSSEESPSTHDAGDIRWLRQRPDPREGGGKGVV